MKNKTKLETRSKGKKMYPFTISTVLWLAFSLNIVILRKQAKSHYSGVDRWVLMQCVVMFELVYWGCANANLLFTHKFCRLLRHLDHQQEEISTKGKECNILRQIPAIKAIWSKYCSTRYVKNIILSIHNSYAKCL